MRNAMGTGPFRLALREPDRRTMLERNPGWWDKPEHNLDRVRVQRHRQRGDARGGAAVRRDRHDLHRAAAGHGPHRPRRRHAPDRRDRNCARSSSAWTSARDELLSPDVKGKNPFKDLRVRQAFALAIDEQAIASARDARPGASDLADVGPGRERLRRRRWTCGPTVDLAKAKQLLAEAGYPDGFSVTLDCPNDRYVNDEAICTGDRRHAGAHRREGGPVRADQGRNSSPRSTIPTTTPASTCWAGRPTTYDAHNVLFNLLAHPQRRARRVNDGGYSNPKVDALIDQIGVETDQAKRQAMIDEAAKIVQDDVGYIPLHQQAHRLGRAQQHRAGAAGGRLLPDALGAGDSRTRALSG